MKLLFAHDNRFYKTASGDMYSVGNLNYSLWKRYLSVFDSIIVAGRCEKLESDDHLIKMSIASGQGVSFVSIPDLNSPIKKLVDRKRAIRMLENAIAEADVVIARLPSEIGSLACQVVQRMNKPWAVEVVGSARNALWYHGSWKGKLYALVAENRTCKLVEKAPYALYVTQQFLQACYPSHGKTIACSDVELPPITEEQIKKRLLQLKQPKKTLKIGMVQISLDVNYKGLDTVLQALQVAKNQLPRFELYILGGGETLRWRSMAENLGVEEFVTFSGTLPNRDPVYQWLDNIDLYIQPSRTEGLPRALLEAMSRGCPAIGSCVGGIPELLPAQCLFKPGNYKTLAALMVDVLNSEERRLSMVSESFNTALKYTQVVLDSRRLEFWNSFRNYALKE